MKDVFARLASDFLSTIIFLVILLLTDNVVLATSVAIAGAIAQLIYARLKGVPLGFMTYASLALVIVLGSATLLTSDPRFVLAKPSIAHFAVGAVMICHVWLFTGAFGGFTGSLPNRLAVRLDGGVAIFFFLSGFLLYRPLIAHRP